AYCSRYREIVEVDEALGQAMLIGCDRAWKLRERRIAIADAEITEHLIVRAVLLDDVNDVPDPRTQRRHQPAIGFTERQVPAIVLRDLLREGCQRRARRHRDGQQTSLLQIQHISVGNEGLVARRGGLAGCDEPEAGPRICASGAARVDDVTRASIAGHADILWTPSGRAESDDAVTPGLPGRATGEIRRQVDHREGIGAAIGDVERTPVR